MRSPSSVGGGRRAERGTGAFCGLPSPAPRRGSAPQASRWPSSPRARHRRSPLAPGPIRSKPTRASARSGSRPPAIHHPPIRRRFGEGRLARPRLGRAGARTQSELVGRHPALSPGQRGRAGCSCASGWRVPELTAARGWLDPPVRVRPPDARRDRRAGGLASCDQRCHRAPDVDHRGGSAHAREVRRAHAASRSGSERSAMTAPHGRPDHHAHLWSRRARNMEQRSAGADAHQTRLARAASRSRSAQAAMPLPRPTGATRVQDRPMSSRHAPSLDRRRPAPQRVRPRGARPGPMRLDQVGSVLP